MPFFTAMLALLGHLISGKYVEKSSLKKRNIFFCIEVSSTFFQGRTFTCSQSLPDHHRKLTVFQVGSWKITDWCSLNPDTFTGRTFGKKNDSTEKIALCQNSGYFINPFISVFLDDWADQRLASNCLHLIAKISKINHICPMTLTDSRCYFGSQFLLAHL